MRYFLEVAYRGTLYKGSQTQHNAPTIQGEIERAFRIFFRLQPDEIKLTGSSRTDAGVHARQNFYHFDWEDYFEHRWIYNLNAILPDDIVVTNVFKVHDEAHCRFDATGRRYQYSIYQFKNPFLQDVAYYYPYTLDIEKLKAAAAIIKEYSDFTSFSKRNTQVKTFICDIISSHWFTDGDRIVYEVAANRFLRGMVRALTATMLKVGRSIITLDEFRAIIEAKDCTRAYFDTPAHGLTLVQVYYPYALD
ncbi:tRNA pseudouridine synthase A [Mycovorax composti]|uniref:tRNA pseudouridine synthase A n=2 Tax=Chitinophagaceae TaxID=563835 RepID=A0ABZ2EJA9_9BACT